MTENHDRRLKDQNHFEDPGTKPHECQRMLFPNWELDGKTCTVIEFTYVKGTVNTQMKE